MRKPTLHPLTEWTTADTFRNHHPDRDAPLESTGEALHADYDHRPLRVGPLEHFTAQARSERFLVH